MKNLAIGTLLLTVFIFEGCASDKALFVTKTSIGIDVDTKPPNVSLAYDRTEGFFGPRYDNGAMPPVIASIRTDGTILDPRIKQVYATGEAARILVDPTRSPMDRPLIAEKAEPMFFGTSTTLGFKVSFSTTSGTPDSLTFGYKRKEASFIPLGVHNGEHHYASVLAAIDSDTSFKKLDATKNNTTQFFASGFAAESLAQEAQIRHLLIRRAAEAVADDRTELTKALATMAGTDKKTEVLVSCVTNSDGSVDTKVLQSLVSAAPSISLAARNDIVRNTDGGRLGTILKEDYDTAVPSLFESIDQVTCVDK